MLPCQIRSPRKASLDKECANKHNDQRRGVVTATWPNMRLAKTPPTLDRNRNPLLASILPPRQHVREQVEWTLLASLGAEPGNQTRTCAQDRNLPLHLRETQQS